MREILSAFLAVPAGLVVGVVTGLFPGIHVNVVASMMVGFSAVLLQFASPLAIALFIVCVAVSHAFFDIIPTLFLGVPDEASVLLPTQRLVREGKGLDAMYLSLWGSWYGLVLTVGLVVAFLVLQAAGVDLLRDSEQWLKPYLFWVLGLTALVLIGTDPQTLWAGAIFLISGLFGITIFATPLIGGGSDAAFSALFPALSGLFGVSGLVLTLFESSGRLPQQTTESSAGLTWTHYGGPTIMGTIGGMVVGLLPGLGAANIATLFSLIQRSDRQELAGRQYIVTTSSINVGDTVFGIASLYFLGKARSGASVAIGSLLGGVSGRDVVIMLLAMLLTGRTALVLLRSRGLSIAKVVEKLHYKGLSVAIIGLIATLVWFTTGPWGMVILGGTTALGMVAPLVGARRAQAMGMFLLPVTLYYSGRQAAVVTMLRLPAIQLPAAPPVFAELLMAIGIAGGVAVLLYIVMARMVRS